MSCFVVYGINGSLGSLLSALLVYLCDICSCCWIGVVHTSIHLLLPTIQHCVLIFALWFDLDMEYRLTTLATHLSTRYSLSCVLILALVVGLGL